VVCATHRDLEKAVREGRFREDLYYRIRVVEIELPPLRARGGDEIDALALHFADTYAARYGRPAPVIDAGTLARLREHAWPGNVRELEHWIESAVVLSPSGVLSKALAPSRPRTASKEGDPPPNTVNVPLGLSLDEAGRRYMMATLEACDNNKAEAARRLGVGRNTLARLLK